MVFLRLWKPSSEDLRQVAEEAQTAGFNYPHVGATAEAHSLPAGWVMDHCRVQLGHGKQAYQRAKQLLCAWQHFQLGWANVDPSTPVKEGALVCVAARSVFMWSANPLRIVYVQEGPRALQQRQGEGAQRRGQEWRLPSWPVIRWPLRHEPAASSSSAASSSTASSSTASRRSGGALGNRDGGGGGGRKTDVFAFAHGCLHGHLLAGEERFSVEWDRGSGAVHYDILTFSRPAHLLAALTYPLVRAYQAKFGADSCAAMVRQVAESGQQPRKQR